MHVLRAGPSSRRCRASAFGPQLLSDEPVYDSDQHAIAELVLLRLRRRAEGGVGRARSIAMADVVVVPIVAPPRKPMHSDVVYTTVPPNLVAQLKAVCGQVLNASAWDDLRLSLRDAPACRHLVLPVGFMGLHGCSFAYPDWDARLAASDIPWAGMTHLRDGTIDPASRDISAPLVSSVHHTPEAQRDRPPEATALTSPSLGRRDVLVSFVGSTDGTSRARALRERLAQDCARAPDSLCTALVRRDAASRDALARSMRLKRASTFCLEPPGFGPHRKSMVDSLLLGCIPVLFEPSAERLLWREFWEEGWRGATRILLDGDAVVKGEVDVLGTLRKRRRSAGGDADHDRAVRAAHALRRRRDRLRRRGQGDRPRRRPVLRSAVRGEGWGRVAPPRRAEGEARRLFCRRTDKHTTRRPRDLSAPDVRVPGVRRRVQQRRRPLGRVVGRVRDLLRRVGRRGRRRAARARATPTDLVRAYFGEPSMPGDEPVPQIERKVRRVTLTDHLSEPDTPNILPMSLATGACPLGDAFGAEPDGTPADPNARPTSFDDHEVVGTLVDRRTGKALGEIMERLPPPPDKNYTHMHHANSHHLKRALGYDPHRYYRKSEAAEVLNPARTCTATRRTLPSGRRTRRTSSRGRCTRAARECSRSATSRRAGTGTTATTRRSRRPSACARRSSTRGARPERAARPVGGAAGAGGRRPAGAARAATAGPGGALGRTGGGRDGARGARLASDVEIPTVTHTKTERERAGRAGPMAGPGVDARPRRRTPQAARRGGGAAARGRPRGRGRGERGGAAAGAERRARRAAWPRGGAAGEQPGDGGGGARPIGGARRRRPRRGRRQRGGRARRRADRARVAGRRRALRRRRSRGGRQRGADRLLDASGGNAAPLGATGGTRRAPSRGRTTGAGARTRTRPRARRTWPLRRWGPRTTACASRTPRPWGAHTLHTTAPRAPPAVPAAAAASAGRGDAVAPTRARWRPTRRARAARAAPSSPARHAALRARAAALRRRGGGVRVPERGRDVGAIARPAADEDCEKTNDRSSRSTAARLTSRRQWVPSRRRALPAEREVARAGRRDVRAGQVRARAAARPLVAVRVARAKRRPAQPGAMHARPRRVRRVVARRRRAHEPGAGGGNGGHARGEGDAGRDAAGVMVTPPRAGACARARRGKPPRCAALP